MVYFTPLYGKPKRQIHSNLIMFIFPKERATSPISDGGNFGCRSGIFQKGSSMPLLLMPGGGTDTACPQESKAKWLSMKLYSRGLYPTARDSNRSDLPKIVPRGLFHFCDKIYTRSDESLFKEPDVILSSSDSWGSSEPTWEPLLLGDVSWITCFLGLRRQVIAQIMVWATRKQIVMESTDKKCMMAARW